MSNPTSPSPDLLDIQLNPSGINVLLPNHSKITSTHKAKLNIPTLPDQATSVHLFPSFASGSLLSVGQLYDAGCTATFTRTSTEISHNGQPIIQGKCHPATALWHLNPVAPATPPPLPSASTSVGLPCAAARIMQRYSLHLCLFYI